MNISPDEAEEELAVIRSIVKKTRHMLASDGTYIFLIVTGLIWLTGFMCTQILSCEIVTYILIGLCILGSSLATILNIRNSKHIHSLSASATAKRIGLVWLLLAVFCIAAIAVAWPVVGKQLTVFIVLFVMIGYLAMGLMLSYNSMWPGFIIIALTLIGYFLVSDFFYLWISLLGGGGMIILGLYIHYRW
jgi:hypothetical protein